jgi:hypothetical protein
MAGEYADGHLMSGVPASIECPAISKDFSLLDVIPGGGGGGYSISGDITLPGVLPALPGTLTVFVSTSEGFQSIDYMTVESFADLSAIPIPRDIPFIFHELPAGTYYLASWLNVNSATQAPPAVGDYAGKFNDGKVPALFTGTWVPSVEGTVPWPITLEADSGGNGTYLGSRKTGL